MRVNENKQKIYYLVDKAGPIYIYIYKAVFLGFLDAKVEFTYENIETVNIQ